MTVFYNILAIVCNTILSLLVAIPNQFINILVSCLGSSNHANTLSI
nr:MAG TPA: hypothetical protein [Crassvirales sp.]